MERLIEICSIDEKKFYIYKPGSSHLDESYIGKLVFVDDFDYLDENFNKFLGNRNIDTINNEVEKLKGLGLDVFAGPHSPEIEDRFGNYVPNENNNTKGIWQKATKEELVKYKNILTRQQEEKQVKKLA